MTQLRAAVIGASGIGKHHAKWLHFEGCDVVAFVGTSEESVARTQQVLEDLFGFEGEGFTSVEEMLAAKEPHLVSVASPPEAHYDNVLACAATGTHVLCEKPVVWYADKRPQEMMEAATEMAEALDDRALVGAVNTQYVAALEPYFALCSRLGLEREAPREMFMQLDSKGARGPVDYEDIWRDLGSHPVSVMMAFCGYGRIDPKSLEVTCAPEGVRRSLHLPARERAALPVPPAQLQ
ncbi:MAG: Gfo/Idh/MocA family oxidoreductase [Armatimonadetes bacterium]|nr:Gfo/Idh/MocA family oxidoreductase [Armatimonadota bacterium]